MKKTLRMIGLLTVMMVAYVSLTSLRCADCSWKYNCTVKVYFKNGDAASNVTVTADYAGFAGGMHDFKTNGSGEVKLGWESHRIKGLYIKKDYYEVDYSDGKSYSLTIKKNKYD